MSVHQARAAAVVDTMARIRTIEHELGVTNAALERIKQEVIGLATQTGLFPPAHFPVPAGKTGMIYRLSEDADRRFALYASAGVAGKKAQPHNHTTWAVISGVFGDEHNVFYRRTDDRSVAGQGKVEKTGELTVRKGNAVAYLPDDFHTIEVLGQGHALHLHCYGMSLENLPGRIFFTEGTSGAYKHFPPNPNIRTAVIDAASLRNMLGGDEPPAIIDVRSEAEFARGHLPHAMSMPAERIGAGAATELAGDRQHIVLVDAQDDGSAERAALALMHRGHHNLSVLAGGIAAWTGAGLKLAA
jgi:rhodanese-related sulfurtransferase/predicted metal-dependent enzyme (double-stranded beta helix superfamily)